MSNLYMENWDLQTLLGESMETPSSYCFDPWSFQLEEDDLLSFPEFFEPGNPKVLADEDHHVAEPEKQKHQQSVSPKPKRSSRKNQQNRVVRHVTVDDLQSDIWAWRKYGQKPIKGSPYPRSYYRRSLKGCLARKQVERSCSDPKIFIITYIGAEHSHDQPTRRNSLAGSSRNKSSKSVTADKNEPQDVKEESIKMEELRVIEDVDEKDKALCDELVQGFEGFEGLFLDQFSDLSRDLWSNMNESMQP